MVDFASAQFVCCGLTSEFGINNRQGVPLSLLRAAAQARKELLSTKFRRGTDDNYRHSGRPRCGAGGCDLVCEESFGRGLAVDVAIDRAAGADVFSRTC